MIVNELIFLSHTFFVSATLLLCLRLGKSALISFLCVLPILANLLVLKQITLFGCVATCSDAYVVGATLGFNLLNEYYGKELAHKTIGLSFILLVFYTIMTVVHNLYLPISTDCAHAHYQALLHCMPRLTFASLISYVTVTYCNIGLYAQLKKHTGTHIVIRNYGSIVITQLLDTVLFSFLGLYGLVDNLGSIIAVSYCIKLVAGLLAMPFVGWSKKLIP